jgi:hypothetical protein
MAPVTVVSQEGSEKEERRHSDIRPITRCEGVEFYQRRLGLICFIQLCIMVTKYKSLKYEHISI